MSDAMRELFVYHKPTEEEVRQINEIAVLGKTLAERISLIPNQGPHSLSGDFRRHAVMNLKTAIMQANTAIIVGRVLREKKQEDSPSAEDQVRSDLRRATNALEILAGSRAPQNFASDVTHAVKAGYGKGSDPNAGQAEPTFTAKEVIERIKKANPGLVIKVRRRKVR
jgi:hypothetical protein